MSACSYVKASPCLVCKSLCLHSACPIVAQCSLRWLILRCDRLFLIDSVAMGVRWPVCRHQIGTTAVLRRKIRCSGSLDAMACV
eukprot:6191661-Pleurochrysis_carterae.AAC.3